MKTIIKTIKDIDTTNFDTIERDVTEIQCLLAERRISYNGILVSITCGKSTGNAYVFKNN